MGDFAGKTVIVTGGGKEKSVGYGVARAFAGEGANLVLIGANKRKLSAARELEREFDVQVSTHFMAEPSEREVDAAVSSIVSRFDRIDVLVCCLQAHKGGKLLAQTSGEEFDFTLDRLLGTCFRWMRASYPQLRKTRGMVLNFVSGVALEGRAGMSALAAASAGIQALSRSAADEWERDGIGVEAVHALAQTTQLERWAKQFPEDFEAIAAQVFPDGLADVEHDVGAKCVKLARSHMFPKGV